MGSGRARARSPGGGPGSPGRVARLLGPDRWGELNPYDPVGAGPGSPAARAVCTPAQHRCSARLSHGGQQDRRARVLSIGGDLGYGVDVEAWRTEAWDWEGLGWSLEELRHVQLARCQPGCVLTPGKVTLASASLSIGSPVWKVTGLSTGGPTGPPRPLGEMAPRVVVRTLAGESRGSGSSG